MQQALDAAVADRWAGLSSEDSMTLFGMASVNFFGMSTSIRTIDTEASKNFVRHCREDKGNGNSTINKKVSALRVMLTNATEYKNSGITDVPKLKAPQRAKGGRKRHFSDAEEQAILDTLTQWGKVDHHDAVLCLIQTGLRPVELYYVTGRDVLPSPGHKHGIVMVYGREGKGTKNGANRSVPLTAKAAKVIKRRAALVRDDERLFPFTNPWMRHTWDNVREHLGFGNDSQFIPYTCRHTCASRLVMKGVPLPVVMEWMGHSNITQTMNYAHLAPVTLFNAAVAMDAWNEGDTNVVSLDAADSVG